MIIEKEIKTYFENLLNNHGINKYNSIVLDYTKHVKNVEKNIEINGINKIIKLQYELDCIFKIYSNQELDLEEIEKELNKKIIEINNENMIQKYIKKTHLKTQTIFIDTFNIKYIGYIYD